MNRTVLAATDFSEPATFAVQRAVQLVAAHPGTSLTVAHVISASLLERLRKLLQEDADTDLRRRADEALAALTAGLQPPADRVLLEGAVRVALADFVNLRMFDLTVFGAHGVQPVSDVLLGSTTERVLRLTRRPLLAVKQPPIAPYQRVLAALDESPFATSAIRTAHAWLPHAEFVFLHVLEPDLEVALRLGDASDARIEAYRSRRHVDAQGAFHRIAASLPVPDARRSLLVASGVASTSILDHAARMGADLIVMGKRGLSAVQELLIGSVTQQVLSRSTCDVLVAGADMATPA